MKISKLFVAAVACCMTVVLCDTVSMAQPPQGGGRGPGGFGGGFGGRPGGGFGIDNATLLGARQVREELKIDDTQGATLDAAIEAYREKRRAAMPDFRAFRELSDEERTAQFEKARKEGEALSKEADETIGVLLDENQMARLKQIAIQVRLNTQLVETVKSDELKSKLNLTEDQLAKLATIEEQVANKQREMMEGMRGGFQPGGDRNAMRERFEKVQAEREKLTKQTHTDVMALMTDEQKKALDEVKGTPFDLDMRQLMMGRGAPGGGRGGDGQRGGQQGRERGNGGRGRPPAEDGAI